MQTNAAVATKVQTSNPFTAITTFVATLALWYALAAIVKNLQSISSGNNIITVKAKAASSENKIASNFCINNNKTNSNNNNNKSKIKNVCNSIINSHSNNSKSGNCATTNDKDNGNDVDDDNVSDDKDDDNGNNADFTTSKSEVDICKELCNINVNYCGEWQQLQLQPQPPPPPPTPPQLHYSMKHYRFLNIVLKKWNQRHVLR